VVCECARAAGWTVAGFLDDAAPDAERCDAVGLKHLGPINQRLTAPRAEHQPCIHAAVGDAALRRKWLDLAEGRPAPPIVHPSAVVSPSAELGEGVFIGQRAVVNARVRLGRGVIVNTGAIVEHDCVIGDFAHLAPGSVLAGTVGVGESTLIGANATVIPGITIGSQSIIGAGAVVIRDAGDDQMIVGVPGLEKSTSQQVDKSK
jgi:sugar O-acyltransferase (sialic acid O-acetyltransferase NeuD family)